MVLSTPDLAVESLDSVSVDPAHHEVLFENDQVRVVRWVVAPGDTTLYHSHPENLNICLTDYNGRVTGQEATTSDVHAKAGSLSWRQSGSHAVANLARQRMEGILVEPRHPGCRRPQGSPDPVVIDPQHHTVEFENEHLRVLRERREPGNFPMHGHPDNVQVLLTDCNATLRTADGRTQTIFAKAGDVRWRAATQHEGVVLGGTPVEQIVVEMKG
jgi:beta-alanine degradation protein BauB